MMWLNVAWVNNLNIKRHIVQVNAFLPKALTTVRFIALGLFFSKRKELDGF